MYGRLQRILGQTFKCSSSSWEDEVMDASSHDRVVVSFKRGFVEQMIAWCAVGSNTCFLLSPWCHVMQGSLESTANTRIAVPECGV